METRICKKCGRELLLNRNYFYNQKNKGKGGFSTKCRECHGQKFLPEAKDGYLICNKCNRHLPATAQYFQCSNTIKRGFTYTCKECMGCAFKPIPKDGYKICTSCNKEILATHEHFSFNKRGIGGLHPVCKICTRKYHGKRYQENREYVIGQVKKYTIAHKKEKKDYDRRYWVINKDRLMANSKIRGNKYRKSERGRATMRIIRNRRRSMENGAISTLTTKEWTECKNNFYNRCAYCGNQSDELTQDHVIALSKGGYYTRSNIVPACRRCNSSKHRNEMESWYRSQSFFSEKCLGEIHAWIGFSKKTNTQQLSIF